jgi:cytochrome b6-f complex iron-sulfur subunit
MAITRKEFLTQITIGGLAIGASSALVTLLESCSNPTEPQGTSLPTTPGTTNGNKVTVDISAGSSLVQNGYAIVQYTGGSILVAHLDDGSYHAMTSVCTHQGCAIDQYNAGSKEFICPCHGSRFNTSGGVTNGPASTALKQYATSVSGNQLTITLA